MNKLQKKHNNLLYFLINVVFLQHNNLCLILKNYNEINDFLKKTSNSAKIVAISKNHPLKSVLEAINAGVYIFGENRVQEAQEKFEKLKQINQK